LFHGTLQLKSSRKIRSAVSYLIGPRLRLGREQREEDIDIPQSISQDLTHTSVELHESLLDDKEKEQN
jgi:hypothetical protein